MMPHAPRKLLRCAIYTRKSTEHNLDLEFNSLDAQREACEAYIKSQAHEGWRLVRARYDDGGLSGASLDRPALQVGAHNRLVAGLSPTSPTTQSRANLVSCGLWENPPDFRAIRTVRNRHFRSLLPVRGGPTRQK
jgi:hypothetical protein